MRLCSPTFAYLKMCATTSLLSYTGNFGNVLAGWLVERMGLPIKGFRVATNQNDILHRLFQAGTYQLDEVAPSVAPSMDIQVASNFERFLYYVEGCDPKKVREIIQTFKETGKYVFKTLIALGSQAHEATTPRSNKLLKMCIRSMDTFLIPTLPVGSSKVLKQLSPPHPQIPRHDSGCYWQEFDAHRSKF